MKTNYMISEGILVDLKTFAVDDCDCCKGEGSYPVKEFLVRCPCTVDSEDNENRSFLFQQ